MLPIIYGIGALLALAGGALSFYFYAVYRRWIGSSQWWVPRICEMDSKTCTTIVDTAYGQIGGAPNALTGMVYMGLYSLALAGVPLGLINPFLPLFMGLVSLLLGAYLIYGLIRLKTLCPVCITVHSINLIIFILQLLLII